MKLSRRLLAILLGVVLFLLVLLVNPLHLDDKANKILAVAALMITWWIGEAMPLYVVALFPLVLFPLMQIASLEDTAVPYANPVIFLFMGGFMIGLAIEKWNLHKRIALNIVRITGTSGNRIILGFILSTGFLSMWLSNTATTMMMYPIALSVIHVIEQNQKNGNTNNTAICLMLSIAYASNFGGIATIIGTPPNVAYVAFLQKHYQYTVPFIDWMLLCMPLSIILMFALYFLMTKVLYPNHIKKSAGTAQLIQQELKQMGKLTTPESRVLIIFVCTAALWITKDIINSSQTVIKLDDTMIAMAGALALFITPSSKERNAQQLLQWADTTKMAWGILLLFGGGISLANQLEKAGLVQQLGTWIAGFSGSSGFVLVLLITVVSIFISEVTSNVAQVIVFAPVMSGIADALHSNPLLLGIPMTLAASCAAMLPMGTPPNAIVFASGRLQLKDMVRTGLIMNVVSIVLITLFCWFLIPLFIPGFK